jgi:hypothetical protein
LARHFIPQVENHRSGNEHILKGVGLVILITSFAYAAVGGVISGIVKDPDGSAFKGAFVRAQNAKTQNA